MIKSSTLTSAEEATVGPSYVSSLTSVVKTIEVDPGLPGNRDEFPFPRCPVLDSLVVIPSVRWFRNLQSQGENLSSPRFAGKNV